MKKDKVLEANQLATIAANLLNDGILEADRTTAKRIFRELEASRRVTLTNLKMEDGGTVRMDLDYGRRGVQWKSKLFRVAGWRPCPGRASFR
jgi:hypothetical protein